MQVDWLTVGAQLVNLILLIWLLHRFLYRPILTAVDEREERIASRIESAREREREADERAESLRAERERLERARDEMLDEARREAEVFRHRAREEMRGEIESERERWLKELRREQEEARDTLKMELSALAVRVARRILEALSSRSLEHEIVGALLRRLEAMPVEERRAFLSDSSPLRITSAFELSGEDRERLRDGLRELLGAEVEPEYARDPDMICGIGIATAGRKLEWSTAEHLDELERHLSDVLGAARPRGMREP